MPLDTEPARAGLAAYLAATWDADTVVITAARKLSGGAIQENWALDLDVVGGKRAGQHALVLRTDAPSGVAVSHGRAEEYALIRAAHTAGVTVPEPILLCEDQEPIGRPFWLMARVAGLALGPKVVKETGWGGDRPALLRDLGRQLARIHAITPATHDLPFLPEPPTDPARSALRSFRAHIDAIGRPFPVLEWGLAVLERTAPASPTEGPVLAHHDFRTGNLMLDETGLTAVLDWEFAGWSDGHEDIGWFCAACWRFSRRDLEAGGLGHRADFYAGYEAQSGRQIDPARVAWWEAFAHLRWAVIALQQGERFLSGAERALEPALIGRRAVEMEWDLLTLTLPLDPATAADGQIGALERPILTEDAPGSAALLDIAEATLRDRLLPALPGDLRLDGLMLANALAIARRGLGADDRAPDVASRLAAGLRSGQIALTAPVWDRLRTDARARLAIANPRFLEAAEALPAGTEPMLHTN